jgi:hypothetical protein
MKTEKFPAFLSTWDEPKTSENGRKYQRLIVCTPPRKDDFGNEKGPGDTFELMLYGENEINAFWRNYRQEESAHPLNWICYVNSRERDVDGAKFYNSSLTVKSYEWKYKNG